jgi:Arc/MetJ-type ribon-helix-helix transcriptional regulator
MTRHALALRKLAKIAEGSGVMTIHLKADQEDRIAEAVRSGAYQSPDEVIDRALEVLQAHDQ